MKAATTVPRTSTYVLLISIHAAREGGDCFGIKHYNLCFISIHAAREGGDVRTVVSPSNSRGISIHAAREGGDAIIAAIDTP